MNKAVIFDMDGVLVDNSKVHDEVWALMCQKYGKPEAAKNVKNIFGGTNSMFVEQLLGITDTKEINRIAKEKEALYREVFKKTIKAPDGLIGLLNDLKNHNARLAVGTSGPKENLDFVLDSLNIRDYFEVLVDETLVKNGKPDPEIYLKVSEKLNISPAECVVIEDSIFGIQSAKRAGMKVIAITTSFPSDKLSQAEKIIASFTELNAEIVLNL
jgi:beta-phosphoglucomutase family hydrolase